MAELLHGPVADREAITGIAERAHAADAIAPLSEQFLLGLSGPGPHLLADGGYAGIVVPPAGGPGAAEAVVAPERRGRGLGRELVTRALELLGDGGTVWAHGDLPAARAVAARLHLTAVRTLLNLSRPLDPSFPAPTVPDGVRLRGYAGPGDDAAILAVNNAAFATHPEQGGWTQQQIDARTGAGWFDPAGLILAVDADDALLGFHWTKVPESGTGSTAGEVYTEGEVYIVAVAPHGQGRGLGKVLTDAGLHHLAGRAVTRVQLYVEGDNHPALRTYAGAGFSERERHVAYAQR